MKQNKITPTFSPSKYYLSVYIYENWINTMQTQTCTNSAPLPIFDLQKALDVERK